LQLSKPRPTFWHPQVGARRLRHAGAHRYVFRLGRNRREREQVVLSLPTIPLYPNKFLDAA
jgi:hypothetical protein